MAPSIPRSDDLQKIPLHNMHERLGARMVGFAGYAMPLHYADGVMAEHIFVRQSAGLFDVSHMGQIRLSAQNEADPCAALCEQLVPANIINRQSGEIAYSMFTHASGGILDDLMITCFDDYVWLVVNAACKADDSAHIDTMLKGKINVDVQDRALLALQGPQARPILAQLFPHIAELPFMQARWCDWKGESVLISCCGYTGEDGFEVSLLPDQAEDFAMHILQDERIKPIGLGARDSLRLEAGLCLYGHDIDTQTSPIAADLAWTIPKRRRAAKDFPGADIICQQIEHGTPHKRVGILPQERAPAREGTLICDKNGQEIGHITSGGFSPSLKRPIAMGYVQTQCAQENMPVDLIIRGKKRGAHITPLPFIPHNYKRNERG